MPKREDIVITTHTKKAKWRFRLVTNATISAALLKNIPMRCPDSDLSELLQRNCSVNCVLSNKDKHL